MQAMIVSALGQGMKVEKPETQIICILGGPVNRPEPSPCKNVKRSGKTPWKAMLQHGRGSTKAGGRLRPMTPSLACFLWFPRGWSHKYMTRLEWGRTKFTAVFNRPIFANMEEKTHLREVHLALYFHKSEYLVVLFFCRATSCRNFTKKIHRSEITKCPQGITVFCFQTKFRSFYITK